MHGKSLAAIAALISLLRVSFAGSLTFELPYGQRKCFTEDLPPDTVTRGTMHVASGQGEMTLDVFVSDLQGIVHFHKSNVDNVKFSFKTGHFPLHTREAYRFCVVNQVSPNAIQQSSGRVVRRITLEVETVKEPHDPTTSRLAKQGQVDQMYTSFLSVQNDVDGLIEKMDELRATEQVLSEVNESTSTTILRISLVACVFTILTGVLNFLSLKSFFKRKKLA